MAIENNSLFFFSSCQFKKKIIGTFLFGSISGSCFSGGGRSKRAITRPFNCIPAIRNIAPLQAYVDDRNLANGPQINIPKLIPNITIDNAKDFLFLNH